MSAISGMCELHACCEGMRFSHRHGSSFLCVRSVKFLCEQLVVCIDSRNVFSYVVVVFMCVCACFACVILIPIVSEQ